MIVDRLESILIDCRIPDDFWEGYIGILGIGLTLLTLTGSIKKFLRYSSILLIIEYLILIYCCTIIFRYTEEKDVHLIPFWSYYCFFQGKGGFVHDVILNILIFLPIGFLLGVYYGEKKWKNVFAFTMLFPICIEMAQLIFHKGVPETDDVMHNTIGGIGGYWIFLMVSKLFKSRRSDE